jgi:hypothetical protein
MAMNPGLRIDAHLCKMILNFGADRLAMAQPVIEVTWRGRRRIDLWTRPTIAAATRSFPAENTIGQDEAQLSHYGTIVSCPSSRNRFDISMHRARNRPANGDAAS